MDSKELWELTIAHQFRPTEQTKKRLDAIHEKISTNVLERSNRISNDIIREYGVEVHEVCKKMMKNKPFGDSTMYMELNRYVEHQEEDAEYILRFHRGKFSVYKEVSGGYGGVTDIENNIYIGRVKHLIEKYGK
jgi:hypothetical protein